MSYGHLVLSKEAHEELMLEILDHLCEERVLGGSVGSSSKWRPAGVRLYAALRPLSDPWLTTENNEYVSIMQAVRELLEQDLIVVGQEAGGHREYFLLDVER